ncbi:MAG: hypothetical protein KA297_10650 [Kofleriaceae bacterium]|nr:hypothetical protein [Kofleriaceae bacterium]
MLAVVTAAIARLGHHAAVDAVRQGAVSGGDAAAAVTALCALAGEPGQPAMTRAVALAAAVGAGAVAEVALPVGAVDLLDDRGLVDAVLALGHSGALTGLCAALGVTGGDARRLGLRLAASGAVGPHLVALLLAGADRAAAERALAADWSRRVRPLLVAAAATPGPTTVELTTWRDLLDGWRATHPGFGAEVVAALSELARQPS